MAYREVGMLEVKEVLRLWLLGIGKKRIAHQLGLDVKTVRRYLQVAERCGVERSVGVDSLTDELVTVVMSKLQPAAGRPHGEGWARCQSHRDLIERYLRRGVRLSKIRKLLRREKIVVPYPTLRRFAIAKLGFGESSRTVPVADSEPGQELQLDTGWMGHLEPDLFGHRRRFKAWVFSAVFSRHRFVYPVLRETTETAIEACEAAWQFYGGVFRVLIVDNTKAIVNKADPLGATLNQAFLEYSQSRGFVVDTTRVRSPQDKPRVERAVSSVRDDGFAGERLYDIEQAREHARKWCLEDYGMRRHSRTLRLPREVFEADEQPLLLPAPTEPYDLPLWSEPKVGRDYHAQVQKSLYSLPDLYVGKTLAARADRATVRFYFKGTLVKTHVRVPPGKRSTDPNDLPQEKTAYALRDVNFLQRKAETHGAAVGAYARALLSGELPWTRMRQVYALLSLARQFGDERLNKTCQAALDAEMIDCRKLRRMLEFALSLTPPQARPNVIPFARYLRPAAQYALPLTRLEPQTKGDKP